MNVISRRGALMAFGGALLGADGEVWRFDNLTQLGGHSTTVLGHPRVVDGAVEFNGKDDAIYVDVHPLAGAETFTWEVVFRPDSGGAEAQRFFHLQETGSATRMLFEIRVADGKWCLDSFALSGSESKALMDREKMHPLDRWYCAAAVYDGREYRNYVDGVLQNRAELHLAPQGAGCTSIGTRIDRRDYFKGAVRVARMTRRALKPEEFLRPTRE
jgi:hypothetical protein